MNSPSIIASEYLFWTGLALVAYAYIGYPIVIWLGARLFGRAPRTMELNEDVFPTLSLLIAAHNEEHVIRERLENALMVDYPHEKLDIVVASDGSTDRTVAIVRSFADRGVRLLEYPNNRGKAATLNAAWDELTAEVVILSDANTFTAPDAASRLARWFSMPDVGAVCGRLVLVDRMTGNNVDGLYWRYETFLKTCEARLDALLGANGAIYAIRRDAFVKIPAETIVDDFVIPLLAKMSTGCRLVYDDEAMALEETPEDMRDEFSRRARIGAGGFQSIGLLSPLLSPRHGWLAFSFFSHKLLRWLCPFFMLMVLASNLMLLGQPLYRWALATQGAFYLLAWCGASLPGRGAVVRIVRLTTLFSSMNLALLVGFFRWISGRQRGAWVRTAR